MGTRPFPYVTSRIWSLKTRHPPCRFSWNNAKHFDFHETKRPAGTIIYGTQAPSNDSSLSLSFSFSSPCLLLSLFFFPARGSRTEWEISLSLSLSFSRLVEKRAGGFIRLVFAQLVASVTLFFSSFRPSSWDKPLSRSLIRRRSRDRILSCEASFESSLNRLSLSLSLSLFLFLSFFRSCLSLSLGVLFFLFTLCHSLVYSFLDNSRLTARGSSVCHGKTRLSCSPVQAIP